MSLHITGMIWAHPTSDLEVQEGPAFQPDHITRITRLHEEGGFDRVLAGYWTNAADGFLVLAHAAAVTTRLNFLLAHRPGFVAPTLAARKLATLDQLTGGRLALHVISGGEDGDQRKDGDYETHEARYRRTDEFLEILRRIWTADAPIDHAGEFYRFEQAWSDIRPAQKPYLPIFFGGASDIALRVAARHADVYALFGEPLAETRTVLDRMRAAVPGARKLAFSWSNRPIIGATEKQAWEKAHDIRDRAIAKLKASGTTGLIAAGQAVNSQRLVSLSQRGVVHDERLWTAMAGVLGGRGNSTALVGTAEQVARSLLRYRGLGISHFILRGWDPLPDVAQYGRELIPLLRELADAEDRRRVSVAIHAAAE
ncbi:LLM class flavin-dependent oxidoreductase [Roseomonas hellenica]|uniref:LLM class flavin-dependent oxidoreductase n=1 Tax=Plastoroseomonas hellenica TaxID=2687306 RepID=A0ABS5F4G4_9PROT|nr:LLM class flavin-dependent oxidoreductase [Plastoroseomonas hellenica]MBR0667459.1 LLM class flavin-dependent oxidoreductase [Plastoroseomonas hellenica]